MTTKTKKAAKTTVKTSHNEIVLRLFNKALVNENSPKVSFDEMSKASIQYGYLVHPDLCNEEIYTWLNSQKRDYNSTFYKNWNDVLTKNRLELYIDQLMHYASTYGTNYTGETYLPKGNITLPDFKNFKVILPISAEEVVTRCENMLYSGIALSQDTIQNILTLLNNKVSDLNKVKNKEVKMFLYKETNSLPIEPVEMVRYLVYLATEKTLLIKDKETIKEITSKNIKINSYVEKFGYEKLSSVFLRFKPLFLAFRTNTANKVCVNKLRRLAKKNHEPLEIGYFEKLLSSPESLGSLEKNLSKVNNFKKVTLLQAILVKLKELSTRAYVVRNQKLYIKEGAVAANKNYLNIVYNVIYQDLVKSLSKKKCTVKLPKGLNLTLPTSEKSFIGNYPIGTYFDFSDADNIVGINWRGEDGAQDLDFKLIDINGSQYGWNASYKNHNNSIAFSGDMTRANPEATELFYTTKGFNPCIVKVNLFNGEKNSKFKFFLAKEKKTINGGQVNYMVNPDNIIANFDCEMDSEEKTLGVITENKFILAQLRTGKGRVAGNSVTNKYTEYALNTSDCYIPLESLLKSAGFVISDTNADIDLSELSKDTLINLLSN